MCLKATFSPTSPRFEFMAKNAPVSAETAESFVSNNCDVLLPLNQEKIILQSKKGYFRTDFSTCKDFHC